MRTHSLSFFVLALLGFLHPQLCAADTAAVDRFHAGWKVDQFGGLGDVYYFYPDGLLICQGVRRREFVTIGKWRIEPNNQLILFARQLQNTTLSPEKLEAIRQEVRRYTFTFDADDSMRWSSTDPNVPSLVLNRLKPLPDRTENPYWGLGTSESYDRGMRRELGLPEKESENRHPGENPQSPAETPTAHP